MFDIGFTELMVIFVVTLLVVGPDRLPAVARKLGLYIGKMRRSFQSIKDEIEQELEIEAVKDKLKNNVMLKEAKELEAALSTNIEITDGEKTKDPDKGNQSSKQDATKT